MPVVFDDVRKLATVERIGDLLPIEGADAIEVAMVRAWRVVVKKGEFTVGDPVVYFEEDTALPLKDERFAFLAPRGSRHDDFLNEDFHALKIARLRGVYSQGLVMPLSIFDDEIYHWAVVDGEASSTDPYWTPTVGMDVTRALGLGKWEKPLPVGNGEVAGSFPTKLARKTDSERVQNLVDAWPAIKSHSWQASEKIDGTSCTVIRDENGELRVCSRNLEVRDGDNTYWNVVHKFTEIFDALPNGGVVQFEIAGPGINGNKLALPNVRPFIFDYSINLEFKGRSEWPEVFLKWAAPLVEITIPNSALELVDVVDGLKSVVTPGRLTEGVVFHTLNGELVPEVGDRNTFKVISNKFLLKEK